MLKLAAAVAACVLYAGAASAVTVDGTLDAQYGAAKSQVSFNPALASGDFGAPTQYSDTANYAIYLTSDASSVYGFLKADRNTGLGFANLYFDLNPPAANGSDLGFEIANDRAFIPGGNGAYAENLAGLNFFVSADNSTIEFSIANSLLTGPIAGLDYGSFTGFPTTGDPVTLRLSQSFGYAVAGGATYGANRLGSVTIGGAAAVPEPATWAMMIVGVGFVGGSMRARSRKVRFATV